MRAAAVLTVALVSGPVKEMSPAAPSTSTVTLAGTVSLYWTLQEFPKLMPSGHRDVSTALVPFTSLLVVAPWTCSVTEIAVAPSCAVKSTVAASALTRNVVTAGSSW
jgi:hypothetical protein